MDAIQALADVRQGRPLSLLRDHLELYHGFKFHYDTVRRWFAGEAQIPLEVLPAIAEIWRLTPVEVDSLIPLHVRRLAVLAGWLK